MTPDLSMKIAAVNNAVRLLSDGVGTLPLHLYERVPTGKQRATSDSLYRIFHDRANDEMPSSEWRKMAMHYILLRGDSFNYIERSRGNDAILGFWPMRSDLMEITRGSKLRKGSPNTTVEDNLGKWYYYTLETGMVKELRSSDVLQIPGLGYDGMRSKSVITYAADTLGLARGMEEFNSKFLANGAMLGGVVETPDELGPEGQENLRNSIVSYHEGLTRAHRILILEQNAKFKEIGMKPEDAQLLGSREFEIEEIARFFNIPLHMLQSLSKATNNNIENQSLGFVIYSLRPWLVAWEQWINFRVLNNDPRRFVEFLVDGLLRGDLKSRYESYQVGRYGGWLSRNQIHEFENMNTDPEGDAYWQPVNMVAEGMQLQATQQLDEAASQVRCRFVTLLEQGISRVVTREIVEIRKLIEDEVEITPEIVQKKVYDDFFQSFIRRAIDPTLASFAESLLDLAREPRAAGIVFPDNLTNELTKDALEIFATGHISRSISEISESENPKEMLDGWDARRAIREARMLATGFADTVLAAMKRNMTQKSGGKTDAGND